jgi:hypothetical protein
MKDTCPEYWPTGVKVGLLIPCVHGEKHRGMHINAAGDLRWTGKMTDDERALLRSAQMEMA